MDISIPYVSLVKEDKIYIYLNNEYKKKLESLNIKLKEDNLVETRWIVSYSSETELVDLFIKLRDLDIAFSIGKGWGPSEKFEELREKGLIKGKYKFIASRGPGKIFIEEK